MSKSKGPQPLSQTAIRKLDVGTTVALIAAPHVRFRREKDHSWSEVPRMGVTPRIKTSNELFLLGVQVIN